MKRAIIIGTACALLVSAIAWATQVWRDGVDAGNHPLANVSTFQVNNGVGAGTRCAQFDAAGNLLPSSAACGAGLGGSAGGVSSVTGTAQHISATPTTGAVIVDTIGGYSTGAVTAGNVSMGALASGVNEQVTTAGVAAPLTYAATANDVQFGAASGGGLAQSSTFAFNSNRFSVGQSTFDGNFHAVLADNPTPTGVATWDGRYAVFGQSGPTGGAVAFSYGNTAATGYMTVAVPNSAFVHFQANAADYAWYAGGTSLVEHQDVFGVYDALLTTNGLMKTTGGTGLHATAAAGTDYPAVGVATPGSCTGCSATVNANGQVTAYSSVSYQAPLVACTDYVHIACQSGTSDLSNTDGAVHVASVHDGVGSQHTTTGAWGAHQLLQTDALGSIGVGGAACGNLPALVGADGIATVGATCTVTNSFKGKVFATGGDPNPPDVLISKLTSTDNSVNIGVASGGALVDLGVRQTKIIYYMDTTVSTVPWFSGFWLATSKSTWTAPVAVAQVEYPNDFKAGHIAGKLYLAGTVGSASAITCSATMNGSTIGSTGITFTPGTTTTPVVLTFATTTTGSSTAADTFGEFCIGVAGLTGASVDFSVQLVLSL